MKIYVVVLIRNASQRHYWWVPQHLFAWRNKKKYLIPFGCKKLLWRAMKFSTVVYPKKWWLNRKPCRLIKLLFDLICLLCSGISVQIFRVNMALYMSLHLRWFWCGSYWHRYPHWRWQRWCHTFLSAQDLVNQWLESYQIFMIYNWDITKNWLNLGDLDLIFKVTAVEKLKIHSGGMFAFSVNIVTSYGLSYCYTPGI